MLSVVAACTVVMCWLCRQQMLLLLGSSLPSQKQHYVELPAAGSARGDWPSLYFLGTKSVPPTKYLRDACDARAGAGADGSNSSYCAFPAAAAPACCMAALDVCVTVRAFYKALDRVDQLLAQETKRAPSPAAGGAREMSSMPKPPTVMPQAVRKYRIPQTDHAAACDHGAGSSESSPASARNHTSVGWSPAAAAGGEAGGCPFSQIPCVLYQTWKTHELSPAVCRGVRDWQLVNPEFDYVLFDDDEARHFVYGEYGCEVGRCVCV
jgi:hypothetical protein